MSLPIPHALTTSIVHRLLMSLFSRRSSLCFGSSIWARTSALCETRDHRGRWGNEKGERITERGVLGHMDSRWLHPSHCSAPSHHAVLIHILRSRIDCLSFGEEDMSHPTRVGLDDTPFVSQRRDSLLIIPGGLEAV